MLHLCMIVAFVVLVLAWEESSEWRRSESRSAVTRIAPAQQRKRARVGGTRRLDQANLLLFGSEAWTGMRDFRSTVSCTSALAERLSRRLIMRN